MLTASLHGIACTVDEAELPAESVAFLLEYGFKQYLQDGAAVSAYHMARKGEPKDDKGRLIGDDGLPVRKSEEEMIAERRDGIAKRLENIRNGTFDRRATERLTPEETVRQQFVRERIRAAARAAKVDIPPLTGKKADPEWWQRQEARYYERHRAAVDKEVARRLKANEAPEEFDFTLD